VEADLKTPLPRQFTFTDSEKIRELARRGEAWGRFGEPADACHRGREGRLLPAADTRAIQELEKAVTLTPSRS
jgi:hypothetical protein